MSEINDKIKKLNQKGAPVIFFVTGNNSTGKTALTKEVIKKYDFYQSVNLGIISKLLRFFRPDIPVNQLENFEHNEANIIFNKAIDFMIDSYDSTGVNAIFDGVQTDTQYLASNEKVIGGVILDVEEEIIYVRGEYPNTHFKRSIKEHGIKNVKYHQNKKFKLIQNNGNFQETLLKTEAHLENLLDDKLKHYEG